MWFSSIFDNFISLIYPKICIGCNQDLLKHEENKEVGIYLGKQIAYEMESSLFFNSIDYIIPVPVHPKKEKVRGYNQSLCIANGII